MAKLILASHGNLVCGMADSLKMIVGKQADNIEVYSLKPGENPEDYAKTKRTEIMRTNETHVFITDIKGGSVHTALIQLTLMDHVYVISGMNMALVMEMMFTLHDDITYEEIMKIIEGARLGIECSKIKSSKEEEEDF